MEGWNGYALILKVEEVFSDGRVSVRDWNGHSRIVSLNPHLLQEKISPGDDVTVRCGFITEKIDCSGAMTPYLRRRFSF